MSEKRLPIVAADAPSAPEKSTSPGFFRRYRLPLLLGLIAICLYVGSILYILFGRGPVA